MSVVIALVHVTESDQVSGGSISFVIGANLWSLNTFNGGSVASAGATIVSGLVAIFRNCSVFGSRVSTSTGSGTRKFFFYCVTQSAKLGNSYFMLFRCR
jgi:hypothetical protein